MPAGAAGMLAACVGEEPGRPAQGPGRQVHGGDHAGYAWILGISIRQALRKPESSVCFRDPPHHDKASPVEYGGGFPSPCRHKLGASCLGTGLQGDTEQTGQVENEVLKWTFFGIGAPCKPTTILPPASFRAQHGLSSQRPHCQEMAMARGCLLHSTQRQGGLREAGGEGLCLHIPCPSPLSSGSHPHSIPGAGEKPCFPSASPACRHVLPIRP